MQAEPAPTRDPFSDASRTVHRSVAEADRPLRMPLRSTPVAPPTAGENGTSTSTSASAPAPSAAPPTAPLPTPDAAPMAGPPPAAVRSTGPTPVLGPPPPRGVTTAPGVVTVAAGASTYLNVSARMMNEIVVPYANPRVVKFLRASSRASIQQDGNSLYVSTGNEEFIQLIVKDADAPSAPGFSVTLLPVQDIPGQHVVLRAEGGGAATAGSGESRNAADYVDLLRELMREAARETLPTTYVRDGGWSGATLQAGPIIGRSLYRAIGSQFVIEYYELRNSGAGGVELVETNFATKGVRAIAFVDAVALAPGQAGRMVWVKDR